MRAMAVPTRGRTTHFRLQPWMNRSVPRTTAMPDADGDRGHQQHRPARPAACRAAAPSQGRRPAPAIWRLPITGSPNAARFPRTNANASTAGQRRRLGSVLPIAVPHGDEPDAHALEEEGQADDQDARSRPRSPLTCVSVERSTTKWKSARYRHTGTTIDDLLADVVPRVRQEYVHRLARRDAEFDGRGQGHHGAVRARSAYQPVRAGGARTTTVGRELRLSL